MSSSDKSRAFLKISFTTGLKLLHFGKFFGGLTIWLSSPTCSTSPIPTAMCHSIEFVNWNRATWKIFSSHRSGNAWAKSQDCRLWTWRLCNPSREWKSCLSQRSFSSNSWAAGVSLFSWTAPRSLADLGTGPCPSRTVGSHAGETGGWVCWLLMKSHQKLLKFLKIHSPALSSMTINSTIEFNLILIRWVQWQVVFPTQCFGKLFLSQNMLSVICSRCVRRGNGGETKEILLMTPTNTSLPLSGEIKIFTNFSDVDVQTSTY